MLKKKILAISLLVSSLFLAYRCNATSDAKKYVKERIENLRPFLNVYGTFDPQIPALWFLGYGNVFGEKRETSAANVHVERVLLFRKLLEDTKKKYPSGDSQKIMIKTIEENVLCNGLYGGHPSLLINNILDKNLTKEKMQKKAKEFFKEQLQSNKKNFLKYFHSQG